MKLEDYLKAIKECPDKLVEFHNDSKEIQSIPILTSEFGIYNHFTIHMNVNYDGIVKRFKDSVRYIMIFDMEGSLDTIFYTCTRKDIVNAKIIPYFNDTSSDFDNHAMTIDLFINNYARTDSHVELLDQARAIANVVDEIGQFIIKENIPACMPNTVGWNFRDSSDKVSRIVTHKPTSSIVSNYLKM